MTTVEPDVRLVLQPGVTWRVEHRQTHADRGALLAALDAVTSLLDTYREAERLACITVHDLRATLARVAAVTVTEVAEIIRKSERHATGAICCPESAVQVVALYAARVASPERPPQPDQDHA